MKSSASKVYASLNEREIAQDRRIINQKLRRHLSSSNQYHNDDTGNNPLGDYYDDNDPQQIDPHSDYIDDDLFQHDSHDNGDRMFDGAANNIQQLEDNSMIHNDMKEVCDSMYIGGRRTSTSNMYEDQESLLQQQQQQRGSRRSLEFRNATIADIPSTNIHSSDMSVASSHQQRQYHHDSTARSICIPKTQSMRKQLISALYIFLSFGILLSYFFFLGSCKLINFGK